MLRAIVKTVQMGPEGQIIGAKMRTYDFEAPELEKDLRREHTYDGRSVVGVEVLEDAQS